MQGGRRFQEDTSPFSDILSVRACCFIQKPLELKYLKDNGPPRYVGIFISTEAKKWQQSVVQQDFNIVVYFPPSILSQSLQRLR